MACKELRSIQAFPRRIRPARKIPPDETEVSSRLCCDCGSQPLDCSTEDWYRFQPGTKWLDYYSGRYARCQRCGKCKKWARSRFPLCHGREKALRVCVKCHEPDCGHHRDHVIREEMEIAEGRRYTCACCDDATPCEFKDILDA